VVAAVAVSVLKAAVPAVVVVAAVLALLAAAVRSRVQQHDPCSLSTQKAG